MACGVGRLHPFLRELGIEVFGLDRNKIFIQEAINRTKNEGNYYIADMRDFSLRQKFDVILLWSTALPIKKELKEILTLSNKHLRKKGLLILDVPNVRTNFKGRIKHVTKRSSYKDFVYLQSEAKSVKNDRAECFELTGIACRT